MKIKYFLILAVLLFSVQIFSQKLNHTKQCYTTADFIDPETEKIIKTEAYSEICVQFLTEKYAKIWAANIELILPISNNELLETDEKGNLVYKAIGKIGEINFEIIYLVAPDYTYFVALVLMRNVPTSEYDKKMTLQYKSRR